MKMNIPLFKVFMSPEAGENVSKVLNSGFIGQGPKVDEFEKILEKKFDKKIVTVNSCTAALHLALRLIENSPGDEIITTPLTCAATNMPIILNNYKIKWADINLNNCNIDLDDVERKLSKNTKAIMFVHWGGYPVDLDRVKQIQDKCYALYGHRPEIIEDCAHVWNSYHNDTLIGTSGNFCAFSLQAIKFLTTGDGGFLIPKSSHKVSEIVAGHPSYASDDLKIKYNYSEYYNKSKLLRWFGLDRESSADFRCSQNPKYIGDKLHMNDIAATIGLSNYPYIDDLAKINRSNSEYYNKELQNVAGVTLLENKYKSSYWIYTLRVKNRDKFKEMMTEKGIMVSQVHSRNDVFPCFDKYKCSLPNMDIVHQDMICIPCGWWVTEKDREYIVETIKEGW